MSSNRDLLKCFVDGTTLNVEDIQTLADAKLITKVSPGRMMMTTAGRMLLNGGWVPPGDSASCPDDDSYFPPDINRMHRDRQADLLNQRARAILDAVSGVPSLITGESDPLGKHQHETGAKLDAGKVRLGLVLGAFSNALVEVGKVGTYGAQKYTDNGWLDVPKGKARYTDALLRHIFAEANESHDPDTNLHHAAHAAWNALARLELILRKRGEE